jgi:hypothetical protein
MHQPTYTVADLRILRGQEHDVTDLEQDVLSKNSITNYDLLLSELTIMKGADRIM